MQSIVRIIGSKNDFFYNLIKPTSRNLQSQWEKMEMSLAVENYQFQSWH